MSINTSELGGQLAAEVYKELLTIVRRDLHSAKARSPRQNWRFQPRECSPALRAYWSNLYQDEIAALDKDWAEPRAITPITTDITQLESTNDSIPSVSQSA